MRKSSCFREQTLPTDPLWKSMVLPLIRIATRHRWSILSSPSRPLSVGQRRGMHASSISMLSSQSKNTNTNNDHYTESQKQIMDHCGRLHDSIMPLNEKLCGPLAAQSNQNTALPFVLLVGNHSSGKSSFINYVLGRKVQTAGVAPTDDNFTIVAPGQQDANQDGPSLVGDPDWGFGGLRQFGPTLLHHTQLKIRSNIDSNFILVDSPGMIDAPASFSGMLLQPDGNNGSGGSFNNNEGNNLSASNFMDRGYDFTGVVRWLAQRADIVCLFFDPDKPGTTGETLSVLLHALSGMDHKLLIILNKADQFHRIHDFARAYGSLCWNLSKVIPRKDLPRIYTMCLPNNNNNDNEEGSADSGTLPNNASSAISPGLSDLHKARDEVVEQVRQAPARRLDNVLTSLYDSVHQLLMHAKLLQDLQTRYQAFSRRLWLAPVGTAVAGTLATTGLVTTAAADLVPPAVTGGIVASTIVLTGGLTWYANLQRDEWRRQLTRNAQELTSTFQRVYAREISEGDEYTAALWQSRVREALHLALERDGLMNLAKPSASELARLQSIVDEDLPALRRQVAPAHMGSSTTEP